MGKLIADLTISLDGFISGPNDGISTPMGDGGTRLHDWIAAARAEPDDRSTLFCSIDRTVLGEQYASVGAVIMGRRTFEHGEQRWGNVNPFGVPVFVVTHEAHQPVSKSDGIPFTFVTNGIRCALTSAVDAASGGVVYVAGGASIVQQFIRANLLEELHLHIVPVVLGNGRRLFDRTNQPATEFEPVDVLTSRNVTHLRLRPIDRHSDLDSNSETDRHC